MIKTLLKDALSNRSQLLSDRETNVYRIFHGHGDGDPRWDAERFGSLVVIYVYEALGDDLEDVVEEIKTQCKPDCIWIKERFKRERENQNNHGWMAHGQLTDTHIEVLERGIKYVVEPTLSFNSGLFIDARPAREQIRMMSKGEDVLNLFAYTGSLGVAALKGGAENLLHVDSQIGMCARVRANHEANNVTFDERMFLASDAYRFLKKARKSQRKWSLIVLDPPPQVSPKGTFRKGRGQDFKTLIPLCLQVLQPNGMLVTFLNRRDVKTETHLNQIKAAAGNLELKHCWTLTSGEDFPEDSPEKKLRVMAFQKPEL